MRRVSLLLMVFVLTGTSSLRGQQPSDQSENEAAHSQGGRILRGGIQ